MWGTLWAHGALCGVDVMSNDLWTLRGKTLVPPVEMVVPVLVVPVVWGGKCSGGVQESPSRSTMAECVRGFAVKESHRLTVYG